MNEIKEIPTSNKDILSKYLNMQIVNRSIICGSRHINFDDIVKIELDRTKSRIPWFTRNNILFLITNVLLSIIILNILNFKLNTIFIFTMLILLINIFILMYKIDFIYGQLNVYTRHHIYMFDIKDKKSVKLIKDTIIKDIKIDLDYKS